MAVPSKSVAIRDVKFSSGIGGVVSLHEALGRAKFSVSSVMVRDEDQG